MSEIEQPQYATFNRRMWAATVDVFIISLFSLNIINYLMDRIFPPLDMDKIYAIANPEILSDTGKLIELLLKNMFEQHLLERAFMQNLFTFICFAAYILPFWFCYSATPGKMLMRIKIVDAATLQPMSKEKSIIRFFSYIVSFVPLTFGFIWIMLNKKKLGFHDMLAKTVVIVQTKKKEL